MTKSNEYGKAIQSAEHWVHRNATDLNRLLAEAGVRERIRLEQFYITPEKYERNDIKRDFDGWWAVWHGGHFNLDTFHLRPEIDKGLLHEWLHQLGAIDMYWIPYRDDHILVPDANRPGEKAGCGPDYGYHEGSCFRFDENLIDIMSDLRLRIGPHTAGGLKSVEGIRKSFFGTYLYDTPATTVVKIVDESGTVLTGAELNFYQKVPVPDSPALIDNISEFSVTTDESGLAVLPNRGVTGVENPAGHQLRPNPFGIIDVVGYNSIFLIEMVKDQCTNYEWLTVVDLNLAYWDGQTERAEFTKTIKCSTTLLTAAIHDAPESHDGSAAFTFELRFSEDLDGFSYRTLRDHAFTVTGGDVVSARRLERGKNVKWEIKVEPSTSAAVTVVLPATTDCTAQGAICTNDDGMLANTLELTVPGSSSQSVNSVATGAPTITGTAQVDETLTVSTSGISDADGLTSVAFTYQWLSDDADIDGATGSSYTLVATDEGKAIKVRVSFSDDAGHAETLTSAATSAVAARPNSAATGAPTITGTAQVGETLAADTTGISDADGLTSVAFTYQWLSDDADIDGATGSSNTLVATDEGKAIKVRVSFSDDAGHAETLTSAATSQVAPLPTPLTATYHNAPDSHDGSAAFTFELRFSENAPIGYKTLRDHAFTLTGGEVTKARRLERPANVRWEITVQPSSGSDVTVALPATTDCAAQGSHLHKRRQDAV